MKAVTILGARPQFIKAAPVIRALSQAKLAPEHYLIHTGQHFDHEMSGAFFEDLDLPTPDINLGIGGGTHGAMTGGMLAGIENVLMDVRPDWVLVYGDTDSTLAGALAAAKLHIPVAHIEAGLRSFNRRMPEEINRVVADHLADLLLCPTVTAVDNLLKEGISRGAELVGDVMFDAAVHYKMQIARSEASILRRFAVKSGDYFIATCHRAENTDNPDRLRAIVDALSRVAGLATVLMPLHPRTKKRLGEFGIEVPRAVRILPPVRYLEMIALESNAIAILTDSGGVQKEAYFFGVPCITLRAETEWVETTHSGWNTLVDTDGAKTVLAASRAAEVRASPRPSFYGNADAAVKIATVLTSATTRRR